MSEMAINGWNSVKNIGANLYDKAQEMMPGKETLQDAVKLGVFTILPTVAGQEMTNSTLPSLPLILGVSIGVGVPVAAVAICVVCYVYKCSTPKPEVDFDTAKFNRKQIQLTENGDSKSDVLTTSEHMALLQNDNQQQYTQDSTSRTNNTDQAKGKEKEVDDSVDSVVEEKTVIQSLVTEGGKEFNEGDGIKTETIEDDNYQQSQKPTLVVNTSYVQPVEIVDQKNTGSGDEVRTGNGGAIGFQSTESALEDAKDEKI